MSVSLALTLIFYLHIFESTFTWAKSVNIVLADNVLDENTVGKGMIGKVFQQKKIIKSYFKQKTII